MTTQQDSNIPRAQFARNGSARPSHDCRLMFSRTCLDSVLAGKRLGAVGRCHVRKLGTKPTRNGRIAQQVANREYTSHGMVVVSCKVSRTPWDVVGVALADYLPNNMDLLCQGIQRSRLSNNPCFPPRSCRKARPLSSASSLSDGLSYFLSNSLRFSH